MFFAGERTFGVLTKLDLMDKGTNALDVSFLICVKTTFLSFRMGNLDFDCAFSIIKRHSTGKMEKGA